MRNTKMTKYSKLSILCMAGIFCFPCQLFSHDLWLIPAEKAMEKNPILVLANSGMDFPLSDVGPDPAKFKKTHLVLPDGTRGQLSPAGKDDKSGFLKFLPQMPGIYLGGVETDPKLIKLSAEKFNEYLVSDGLPHIYRLRHQEETLNQPGKERYSKSPKFLVQVGKDGGGNPSLILGLPLEIVPLENPFQRKVGDTLPVRVFFHGERLADANLGWDKPGDGPQASGTVRTNSKGEALIPIEQKGLMTIRLTHMTRPKNPDFEWESFWTTLTFRLD